jgi:hypothetical protein
VARNWNFASAGVSFTALIVANRAGVFTPLRGSFGAFVAGALTGDI